MLTINVHVTIGNAEPPVVTQNKLSVCNREKVVLSTTIFKHLPIIAKVIIDVIAVYNVLYYLL